MFRYDHRQLSLMTLREAGVKSFREIEEVIEGVSVAERYFNIDIGDVVYIFIGFTKTSKPLEIAIRETEDVDIITCDVRTPMVKDIV